MSDHERSRRLKEILPGGKETLRDIDKHLESLFHSQEQPSYGHTLGTFARLLNEPQIDPEKAKTVLRKKALSLIERYGENIKKFLKPELLDALDIPQDKDNNGS